MLVKVSEGVYVNTDHVFKVDFLNDNESFNEDGSAYIYNTGAPDDPQHVSGDAAAYLLDLMEANSALVTNSPAQERPLVSRIATILRDESPNGATIDKLMNTLHLDYHLIRAALDSLLSERVIVYGPDSDSVYYHASHAPRRPDKPAPELDLNLSQLTSDLTPFAITVSKGESQCVECKHRGCPNCVNHMSCCQCNGPFFTPCDLSNVTSAEAIAIHEAEKATKEAIGKEFIIKSLEQTLAFFKEQRSPMPVTKPIRDPSTEGAK